MATADSVSEKTGAKTVIRFRHAVHSDVGRHRTENQDSYAFVYAKQSGLFVVADGMGGARGGATASALAVDIIAKDAINSSGEVSEDSLRQAIEKSNAAIFERSRRDEKLTGMGTTVVALAVTGRKALVAHVGDSRIYLLRSGKLSRLTRDHTLVQELIDSGAISSDQAENHPIAHMLTRSLGPVGAVDVELRGLPHPVEPGDRFVLCSDGLYNMVAESEIEEIVSTREPEQAAIDLVDLANDRGGTDNITVEVIDIYPAAEGESDSVPESQQRSFTSAEHLNGNYGTPELDPDEPIELTSSQIVNETTPTARGSAYDSIIFGESPTADDIRKHEESVRRTQDQPASESSDVPEEQIAEQQVYEDGELRQEFFEDPKRKQQKVQVSALALLVGILAIVSYLIVTNRSPVTPPVPVATGPDKGGAASTGSSVVASAGLSSAETELERAALERELDESASSVSSVSSSIVASVAKSATSEKSASSPTASQSSSVYSTAQVAQSSQRVADEGWPTAAVVPLGTKLLSEDDVVVAPPRSSASSNGVKGEETPMYTGADIPVDKEVARVIADASDLTVPAAPKIEVPQDKSAVDQPIVWEHEEIKIAKASQSESSVQSSSKAPDVNPEKTTPVLLSDKEKQKVLVDKIDIRERIANIDAKLQQFSIASGGESKQRSDEVENQLAVVADGIRQTTENLETAKRRYKVWKERKEALKTKEPKDLASEVALSSVQVKRKKEAFEVASLRYLDAVELWRENPGNDQGASQMATLGKELEGRRAELSEAIISAVDSSMAQAKFDISEFSLVKEDLERRRDRLNRHTGIAKVKPLTNAKARMERQRELLDERAALTAKLKDLRVQLSDQDEVDFRRSLALRVLGLN